MEERNFDTLKLFQMFFAILFMLLIIYGKVTEKHNLLPLTLIVMSVMFLIIGIREYKKTQNLMWGIFYLCTSLFILFVGVKAL
ncbi:DUF3953 domain-containing protein [Sporosarcina sp. FSL K6-6792]|uniref:DUF3953 domain-containing protein n=1 Tax=Sporosarcina sp. FSL K6-6792 TaxID=2921559 RepID=UPI004046DDB3